MNKLMFLVLIIFGGVSLAMAQSTDENWSGFYVGGNGSGSSDQVELPSHSIPVQQITNLFVASRGLVVVPGTSVNLAQSKRRSGGSGGGQAGYQWQAGRFVFGAEGDYNPVHRAVSFSQNYQLPITFLSPSTSVTVQRDVEFKSEYSARGRAGAAIGKILIYGTGGYSGARVGVSVNDTFTNPGGPAALNTCGPGCTTTVGQANFGPEGPVITTNSGTQNINGWNAGGGIEYKFSKHFSLGIEYRHTNFRLKSIPLDNQTVTNTGPETVGSNGATGGLGFVDSESTPVSLKNDSFRFRFNFHF